MSHGLEQKEVARFEENCRRQQERLNWIKEQLRNHQPISEEDNHFFEQFTNTLFANLNRLLNQLNQNNQPLVQQSISNSSTPNSNISSSNNNNNNKRKHLK
jgi:hypothetical protein